MAWFYKDSAGNIQSTDYPPPGVNPVPDYMGYNNFINTIAESSVANTVNLAAYDAGYLGSKVTTTDKVGMWVRANEQAVWAGAIVVIGLGLFGARRR